MVELVSIGDELLIGQVINTNASWMAEEINQVGWNVRQMTSISDNGDEIIRALAEAESRASVVLLTGGLGPTRDDITKEVLCRYFETRLIENTRVLEGVRTFFEKKGLPLTDLNRKQAMVPESALVIDNPLGTAPGLAFERNGKLFVAMPGVPYEMKYIMESWVLPRLIALAEGKVYLHKTILTQGIGESFLSEKIRDWENSLLPDIKLAYLPSPGIVRLRMSILANTKTEAEKRLKDKADELRLLIPHYIWGEGRQTLEEVVGKLLFERAKTLATGESCTGGMIAHRVTSVPGCSAWFKGSIVAYSNAVKIQQLGVPESLLNQYGAVSKEVVEAMAMGVLDQLQTDYAISVSGVAGPDGGSEEKPVGTVWIAVADNERVVSKKFLFGDQRMRNIQRATNAAFGLLHKVLVNS